MLNVVHVSPRVQAIGGIEALHKYHGALPFRQTFVALFDRHPEPRPDYVNLDVTWRTSLGEIRRRYRQAMATRSGSLVVYHNAWGFRLLGDVDGAERRVTFFHADPAYHLPDLPMLAGMLDGAAALAPSMVEVCSAPPLQLPAPRVAGLRAPIEPPAANAPERAGGRPLVLGYFGRVEKAQKRCDRIPELVRALRAAGLEFSFEVIGDGSLRPQLERELAGQVRFHGRLASGKLWPVLSGWDAIVLFSEHEAGPIAMLEGMSVGVLPFCPWMGGSWGDVYAPQVDPDCHYRAGEMTDLAARLRRVFGRNASELAALRARARRLVESHRPPAYQAACANLLQTIMVEPRLSRPGQRRSRPSDLLPLGLVTRLAPALLR
jgi:glycosyltransferase involved in cell wall biosynthesis